MHFRPGPFQTRFRSILYRAGLICIIQGRGCGLDDAIGRFGNIYRDILERKATCRLHNRFQGESDQRPAEESPPVELLLNPTYPY
jgi:hypothetical protein